LHVGEANEYEVGDHGNPGELEVGDIVMFRRFGAVKLEEEARVEFGAGVKRLERRKVLAKWDQMGKRWNVLGDRMIVRITKMEQDLGGLVGVDTMVKGSSYAEVLEVGKGCQGKMFEEGVEVNAGDIVFLVGNGGVTMRMEPDGSEVKMVRWNEIAAVEKKGVEKDERLDEDQLKKLHDIE
jgi:co-chaperonin GroES (HSP10)